jgi:hypothetical protein
MMPFNLRPTGSETAISEELDAWKAWAKLEESD